MVILMESNFILPGPTSDELLEKVARIEIKEGMDVVKDLIMPIYEASLQYVDKVKTFQNHIENFSYRGKKMKYAINSTKYKNTVLKNEAINNANIAKSLMLEGMTLLYSIREKITGDKIVFRTVIPSTNAQDIAIVEIPYNEFLKAEKQNDPDKLPILSRIVKTQDYMQTRLTFIEKNIITYQQEQKRNLNENDKTKNARYTWESSVKKLYLSTVQRWEERNLGKNRNDPTRDKFNRGHIFEYMDQINVARQWCRNNGKKGVSPWKKEKDNPDDPENSMVDYVFEHMEELFDSISFIKGGDTGSAQDKLLNASITSLKGIINTFYGYSKTQYNSGYDGIIPTFKQIINGDNQQNISNILLELFTKQSELSGSGLKNKMSKAIEEEGLNEIMKYMKVYLPDISIKENLTN